ncbi:MAG: copper chaperone PCu(A)C [Caulobacter sp.]|nr:copper chaperone PCu(A)C [Caulobacter sp.]
MNRRILTLALGAALLAGVAQAHSFAIGGLDIGHPWSRPAPQGGNGAGFLSVTSTAPAPDRLVGASSPVAGRVEIHESMIMDGRAMMHPRPGGLPIPAGSKVELKPGGWHLMFIGLKRPLAIGDRFPATLTFQKAGKVQVEFVVQASAGAAPMPEHKH